LHKLKVYEKGELFRHLAVARPAFPLSKLKTVEYLYRYQGVLLAIDRAFGGTWRLFAGL
jgi:hypothetical protein